MPPACQASPTSGSNAIPTAASTALTAATAAIAPRSAGLRRSAERTPYAASGLPASPGAGSSMRIISSAAAATPASDSGATRTRTDGASSSPPSAGPTTKEATSTVTRTEVARAARPGPAAVGIAAARAGYAGVATATAAAAASTAASTWPVAEQRRHRAEQHEPGQQGGPHDPVAAVVVGDPRDRPREQHVGQHPRGPGQPEQRRAAGVLPDQEQQQRPRQRHRHRGQRVRGEHPTYAGRPQRRGGRVDRVIGRPAPSTSGRSR